jgi:hypothetical protein
MLGKNCSTRRAICVAMMLLVLPEALAAESIRCRIRVKVTSPLTFRNTPLDPTIDFAAAIREAGAAGVLDPNSIQVVSVSDARPVVHARTEDFAHGEKGRIEWVAREMALNIRLG